jgi:hypothetical protein
MPDSVDNVTYMLTVIHVTHEAVDHLGGIGTVLQGLMTSRDYRARVGRSILVGPLPWPDRSVTDPVHRLGEEGVACHYSGVDRHDPMGLGSVLQPIEWAFGTRIVYGTRTFHAPGDESNSAEADLLLIDVQNPDRTRLAMLKWFMYEHHGLDSQRYENSWDYEEYTRLAGPAYHALCALLDREAGTTRSPAKPTTRPAVMIAHEFMGVPTALRASEDRARFRTLFHAHECSTARRLTEGLPGFDAAFYPAMDKGVAAGQSVGEVFGDQSDYGRHALVARTHVLDGIMAVGPETGAELQFLSPAMRTSRTDVVYNGLPSRPVTMAQRTASRTLVNQWLNATLGKTPDYLITHVTRPVPSKGLWRDLTLLKHLDPLLRARGQSAAYLLLTCGAPIRTFEQVRDMASRYGWPLAHQQGYPDLVGPEIDLYGDIARLNAQVQRDAGANQTGGVRAILVNQFGFTRQRLGPSAPEGLTTADLRRAADVELGMSTYEPFGIAQLEPLHAGAICVTSTVCGCMGLVRRAMDELGMKQCDLVLPADFAFRTTPPPEMPHPEHLTAQQRLELEDRECRRLAAILAERLPRTPAQAEAYLNLGQQLAGKMSWDHVVRSDFLPALDRALARA